MLLLSTMILMKEFFKEVFSRDRGNGAHDDNMRDSHTSLISSPCIVGLGTEMPNELATLDWDETESKANQDDDQDSGFG